MKKFNLTAIALALVTGNALAQYADHPILRGQSWGPHAQIYAGESAFPEAGKSNPGERARLAGNAPAAIGGTAAAPSADAPRGAEATSQGAPRNTDIRNADSARWGI